MQQEKQKWLSLIGLCLLSFTAFLDYTIVTTALPFIQRDLNASVLELQWVMNIFSLVLCMFMIIAGKAGDILGRKKVFYLGFIFFAIAALGSGFSPTINWLIFFRAIQGFAGAIIFTVGVALLPQAFPENEQARAIGIFSAFNGAGLAVGPFLSGFLITLFSWRWVFWINLPIIIAGILLCVPTLRPAPKPDTKIKIDWLGLLLLIIGIGSLVYGIIYGEQSGWDLTLTWIYIIVGILALVLLIPVEHRQRDPLLDMELFSKHGALLAILVCLTAGLITSVFMFFDPLFLESIQKYSAFAIGLILLSVPIVQVVISLFFEKLLAHSGIYRLIMISLVAVLLSAIMHIFFQANTSLIFILIALMLMGYTWGIANVGSISALASVVPTAQMGNAIGTVFTFWNFSNSLFLAIASVIFHWRETVTLQNQITKHALVLTPNETQQINAILADPAHAKSIISQFSGPIGDKMQHLFQLSFLNGFHWAAGFSAIVMLLILLVGMYLRENKP